MRIAGTLSCSLLNGYGIRYVIFCQGCAHHCVVVKPETWDFNGGEESLRELAKTLKDISI
jgi:anaerobic ribonucleoside-triphosphate reductase activating protein